MRMVLIVGGKAQGKGRLAAELAEISLSQALEGEEISPTQLADCRVLLNVDRLLWRMLTGEVSLTVEELADRLDRPEAIVTCTDAGGGIVPLSREQRDYRDFVGKAGCLLAARATRVYRVFSGISTQIKGEERSL